MSDETDHLSPWNLPERLSDYPAWPHAPSGFLVEGHAGWRLQRPVLHRNRCVGCLQCYLLCPDAALRLEDGILRVQLQLCKGCGVCEVECRHGAIVMEPEGT
jgi:2-oxoacid:acceptor oxidoreductase delta subunit (pyruvate/2-ketoisovalerate family)